MKTDSHWFYLQQFFTFTVMNYLKKKNHFSISLFYFFSLTYFFLYLYCIFHVGFHRNIEFTKSRNGQQILLIDQHRYFKEKENAMVVVWKCHEFYKSKCEAQVATMKKDRTRVVVLNDTHIHLQSRKVASKRR